MKQFCIGIVFFSSLALWGCRPVSATPDPLASFPAPRIIQSHNAIGAVVFWDATAYIEKFATQGTPKSEAIALLEYEAFKIFAAQASTLSATAHHLTVVVAFAKTGAMNARYQTKSFEGVQNVLTLDGKIEKHMRFPRDADRKAKLGKMPPGLKLHLDSRVLDGTP